METYNRKLELHLEPAEKTMLSVKLNTHIAKMKKEYGYKDFSLYAFDIEIGQFGNITLTMTYKGE